MTFITCGHMPSKSAFLFNAFGKTRDVTNDEIKKYKLYKCKDCGYYYSLIGVIIRNGKVEYR